jgi:hypothetical protein
METTQASRIATTILEQLGGGRFKLMTGAKHFSAIPTKQAVLGGLSFRLPGAGGFCKNSINFVSIELTPQDEYIMTFGRVRGGDYKVVSMHRDIQVDQLRSTFTEVTGLAVSL